MKYASLLVLFVAFAAAAAGSEIVVPDDHVTIQEAIDAANGGDTVLVRAGVYPENVDFRGKAVILRSESGPEATTIDGGQQGSPVRFVDGEGAGSVLEGFRLCNGIGSRDSWNLYSGGGICCIGAAPTIVGNIIEGNRAKSGYGGGIYLLDSEGALISENLFTGNRSANCGGGIYSRRSSPVIAGNVFRGNEATKFGGAVTCSYSPSTSVLGNLLLDNVAGQCGGGFASYNSRPSVRNNTICGNSAAMRGGGIYLWLSDQAEVVHNTICDNVADLGGGFACNGASTTIANSILFGNTARAGRQIHIGSDADPSDIVAVHCDIEGGPGLVVKGKNCLFIDGGGLIDADPLFAGREDGDYHLSFPSPCRDAGGAVNGLPPEDFEGDERVVNDVADMGADEFYFHLYREGEVVPGGMVELKVTGWPGMPARLGIGAGLLAVPRFTPFGDLHLEQPINVEGLGLIPETGVLVVPVEVPSDWVPGERIPIQVLLGGYRSPAATFTNLDVGLVTSGD